jgi:rhodanese-related sulfurtransferase
MKRLGRNIGVAMVLALIGLVPAVTDRAARAGNSMSDPEKLARIDELYRGYGKDFPGVGDIEPREAMQLLQEGKALFIDVRTPKEQAVSMLPGAVTAEDFQRDPERYAGRVLIGYCTISYRSGKLAQQLAAKGITLLNLRGGILAWVHAGGKLYDRDGETRRIHVYGRKWDLAPQGYETVW